MTEDEPVREIIPMLVCRDAAAEVEFCEQAFRADVLGRREVEGGEVVHATLQIDGNLLMVHNAEPSLGSEPPAEDGSSSVVIYLYVEDVDATMARAVTNGARITIPAADQFWGDRVGRIVDPAGHVWNVAARVQ